MIGNKRLEWVLEKALSERNPVGTIALDGYNQKVYRGGCIYTITSRTFGDNNHFLLEIYDEEKTQHDGKKRGQDVPKSPK